MSENFNRAKLEWERHFETVPDTCVLNDWAKVIPHPIYEHNEAIFADIPPQPASLLNRVVLGDNLYTMKALLNEGFEESIDLIYIDPPYFSETDYTSTIRLSDSEPSIQRLAFSDKWSGGIESYLDMLYPRLEIMRDLLSPQGNIFVHVDWHTSHYVRMLLDEIFGNERFNNEIVWCYSGGTGSKRHFHRKHDIIFWYSKNADYIFNPQYRPYSKQTLERGLTRVKGPRYNLHEQGALMQDWWSDINKILSPTAYENLKFPTQKPIALMKRIIACASNPGSLVADFFAGTGTLAVAAEELNRQWIIADNSELAVTTSNYRLQKTCVQPYVVQFGHPEVKEGQLELCPVKIERCGERNLIQIGIGGPAGAESKKTSQYLEYWEVDTNFSGCFHSDYQMLPKKRFASLDLSMIIALPAQNSYCIAVRTHDIFGKTYAKIINISL